MRFEIVSSSSVAGTIADAFPFVVSKRPLEDANGNSAGFYGLFRDDTNRPVSRTSVTHRYVPHQVEDVIEVARAATSDIDGLVSISCRFHKHRHTVTIRDQQETKLADGDKGWNSLVIQYGYGTTGLTFETALYKFFCHNLLRIPVPGTVTSWNLKHTTNWREKHGLLIENLRRLRQSQTETHATIERMMDVRTRLDDFVEAVDPAPTKPTARIINSRASRLGEIRTRLYSEHGAVVQPTVWQAFNAFHGYLQHDARSRAYDETERALNMMDNPVAARAWDHALALIA